MNKIAPIHLIIGLLVVAVVGAGGYASLRSGVFSIKGVVLGEQTSRQDYQAVFLTNGQVYFGKIIKMTTELVQLSDIYYLQVQQPIQPPEKPEEKPSLESQGDQPKLTLVKLGNEIHGPTDSMNINRDHILFWEDLKESGQVIEAIKKDKESKK